MNQIGNPGKTLLQDIDKYPELFEQLILIYLVSTGARKASILDSVDDNDKDRGDFLCKYISFLGLFIIVFGEGQDRLIKNCNKPMDPEKYYEFMVLNKDDIYTMLKEANTSKYQKNIGNLLGYFCSGQEGWNNPREDRYILKIIFSYRKAFTNTEYEFYINEVCNDQIDMEKLTAFGNTKVDKFRYYLPPEIKVEMKISLLPAILDYTSE